MLVNENAKDSKLKADIMKLEYPINDEMIKYDE